MVKTLLQGRVTFYWEIRGRAGGWLPCNSLAHARRLARWMRSEYPTIRVRAEDAATRREVRV